MIYRPRWRKAVFISMTFHILFLGSIGWLAGDFFISMESEPYIELELLTDAAAQGAKSNDSSSVAESTPQAATQPETTSVMKSTIASPTVPKVVAKAGDLAVVAVEAESSSQAISDNEQGSSSSAASTNGSNTGGGQQGKGTAGNGGDGSNSGSKQITRPGILFKVEPVYPEEARTAGLEGTVLVKIQILANGSPGDITINRSSGHGILDDAAIAAVRQWRFTPAKNRDSVSIMCYTTMPIVFRLK